MTSAPTSRMNLVCPAFGILTIVMLAALNGPAQGAVVAIDLVSDVGVPPTGTIIPLDLNGDGNPDVRFSVNGASVGFYAFPELHSRIQAVFSGDVGYYWSFDYRLGDSIGITGAPAGASWRYDPLRGNLMGLCADTGVGIVCLGYFWDYPETFTAKYLGLEFDLPDGTHYGYVAIRGSYGFGHLASYAWETLPGVPIVAGSVPEPARSALIVAGIAALLFRRRRAFTARRPHGADHVTS